MMAGKTLQQMSYSELLALQKRNEEAAAQSGHDRGADNQVQRNIAAELNKRAPGAPVTPQAPTVAPAATANAGTAATNSTPTSSLLDLINKYRDSGDINNLIGDASDDNYIDEILTSQASPLLGQLAQDRASGKVSGVGYDAAMAEYNRQRDVGRGTLSGVGSGVIAGGRQSLYDILNEAQSAAIKDPNSFNFDPYKQRVSDTANTFKGGLRQKLLDTIGGTNYFDSNAVMGKIPSAQGSTNTASGSILDALKKNTNAGAYQRPTANPGFGATNSQSPLGALLGNREKGFGQGNSTGLDSNSNFRTRPIQRQSAGSSAAGSLF